MLITKIKNQNKTKFISKSIVWNYCVETERKKKQTENETEKQEQPARWEHKEMIYTH